MRWRWALRRRRAYKAALGGAAALKESRLLRLSQILNRLGIRSAKDINFNNNSRA